MKTPNTQDIDSASGPSLKETLASLSPDRLPKTRRLRFSWRLCLGSLLLLGAGFWLGSSRTTVQTRPTVAENERVLPVEVETPEAVSSYQQTHTYTGEIVAQNTSDLGFERAGKIVQLLVEEGQQVSEGTPLARLDPDKLLAQKEELLAQKQQAVSQLEEMQAGPRTETIAAARAKLTQEQARLEEMQAGPRTETIAAARANLDNLQEQLALARSKSERRQALYSQGAIAREQLDEAITDVNSQQARVREAQSELDELLAGTRVEIIEAQQARVRETQSELDELLAGTRVEIIEAQQATLQQLESRLASIDIDLETSVLEAPFAGKISQRYLDRGTVISPGQAVVRLVQEQAKAHIGIPAALASSLKIGEVHSVKVGQNSYQATVAAILPELDEATRTIPVVLELEDTASRAATAGQIVDWQLEQTTLASGYWLPTTALVRGIRGLWSVYVLGEAQGQGFQIERRDVEILYTDGERVLVRGTLEGHEQIITTGTNRLASEQTVQPVGGIDE